MKYSTSQTIRIVSALLLAASLIFSLTARATVASAESDAQPARVQAGVNPSAAMENSSDAEGLAAADLASQAQIKKAYGQLPLSFEANRGQTNREVKFLSRNSAYTFFLTSTEAVMSLRDAATSQALVLRMKLEGMNPQPQIKGEDELPGKSNYLIGNDPRKWQQGVSHYKKVRYTGVYDGIDMLYYGNQQQLEYDFIVAPFAVPQVIALKFEGADDVRLDGQGNLVLRTKAGEVTQHAPVIYQERDGERQTVSGHYSLRGGREVGFEVGAYDRSRALMIDPVIQFSTILGGKRGDFGRGVAVDAKGNAYVTGVTESIDFPDENEFDPVLTGEVDGFITKFNVDGTALVYSTYIGGNTEDRPAGIAVTKDGKACITGDTGAGGGEGINTFPVTPNRLLGTDGSDKRGRDAFVVVLNAAGDDLVYSSFFGGSGTAAHPFSNLDTGDAIAVDSAGNVYITGLADSFNLPTKNAFQFIKGSSALSGGGDADAYIAKFNPQASTGPASLLYSSYLGGRDGENGNGIAVDKFNVAYVVGSTFSNNFPTKSPSSLPPFQKNNPGRSTTSAFIAKINPAQSGNSSLIYSTYLGGSDREIANAVAVDAQQRAYITGFTDSADFPLKNPFDNTFANNDPDENAEGFVVKMNADGTALFYSSFLGGDGPDEGNGIAVDAQGNAYVAGETESETGFPILNAFQPDKGAFNDAFITKISAVPSTAVSPQILFSSFLGGNGAEFSIAMGLGPKRSVFLTGATGSSNFLTTPGAFQTNQPDFDAFLTRIAEVNDDTIGTFRPSDLIFRLRNSNTAGAPDLNVGPNFYQAGDLPVVGDFNGDGIDTTGIFRAVNANGVFLLSDRTDGSVTSGAFFGQAGDLPIAGDWDGDGKDTIGVFRPSAGKFFLRNSNTAGPPDFTITFGAVGDIPLAGDWDGDGDDTIGVYRESQHRFLLRNKLNAGADINVQFGIAGDLPLTGDWDGDGDDTIGLFRNSSHKFFLRNVNNVANNIVVDFGATGDTPLAGDWDGLSSSTPPNSGVNDPSEGSSRAGEAQVFTTTCSDPDGWRNIHTIDFRIAKPDGQGGLQIALWVQFDQNRQVMRLYNPDTQTWEEGVPGANAVLSNRFVRLRLGGAMVDGSGPAGPSVELTWNVVFEDDAVMDGYKQYLRIKDDAGFSTGFDEVGEWSVTP